MDCLHTALNAGLSRLFNCRAIGSFCFSSFVSRSFLSSLLVVFKQLKFCHRSLELQESVKNQN